jgi:hypothetical protein
MAAVTKLTVEEKVRIQLDALVESYEKRLWSVLAPPGLPIPMFLMVGALAVFVLFWVAVPYMNLLEDVMGVPAPSKAVLKVFGIGLTGYMILLIVTMIQQKVETAKAVKSFDQCFPQGGPERAIALQLLAVKPGRGAKRLFTALGGVSQLVVDSVSSEGDGSGPEAPAFQPIPIEADPAPAKTPAAFSKPGPPPANRGYIPLQPDVPLSEKTDDERPPQQ